MLLRFLICWLVAVVVHDADGQVVINEIFYHSPDDVDRLEWIELKNTGAAEVDLSDWSLAGGVEFSMPEATIVPAGQYLVICRDVNLFREFYEVPAIGGFTKSLGNSGDMIELRNGSDIVEAVTYKDRAPWAVAADGYGASLERISPSAASDASNWAASAVPESAVVSGGTPGAQNDRYSMMPLPQISGVEITPQWPASAQSIEVTCRVTEKGGPCDTELLYQTVIHGTASEEVVVPMSPTEGGTCKGIVPGQATGTLVRVRIRTTNESRGVGVYPSPDLRPAMSLYVTKELPPASVPLAFMISADPEVANALKEAALGGGQGVQARMMTSRVQMMLASAMGLEEAWARIMLDDQLSQQEYVQLIEVFRRQLQVRDDLAAEVLKNKNMRDAMRQAPQLGEKAKREFQQALKGVLGADDYAAYEQRGAAGEDRSTQFISQMVPFERLWLAIESQFASNEEQRPQIRAAMARVAEAREKELVPLLGKLQSGQAGFEELQASAGEVEAAMWAALKPILSFRQRRFGRQWYSQNTSMMGMGGGGAKPAFPRGASAFVHIDTSSGEKQVFDFIDIRPRSAGFKIRFHKDHLFNGMSTANVIFEVKDRFVLAESLAYDFYRRVGAPACVSDFVRLHINDDLVGYHLLFEQPNRAFLRRNGRDVNGDLYKLLWYGKGIEGKYESKVSREYGHEKLIEVVRKLNETTGEKQWAVIQEEFNVDQMIDYFAVNMCLSHWDGFFNNFFAYHDVADSGKWELYPWDQDKTWGFHDGTGDNEVFTDMPLTFGMEGDAPPGGGNQRFGRGWWRPGGEFSKPLLANAQFRKRFLSRLKTIITDTYNEEVYFPIIDELAERLLPEVAVRAEARGEDVQQAQRRLAKNAGLLKEHLTKRRDFLLQQDELKAVRPQ